MKKQDLLRHLHNALADLTVPTIPEWMRGTCFEHALMLSISTPPDVEEVLLELLRSLPEFAPFDGKMYNQGPSYTRIETRTVLAWLLYTSHKLGVDTALAAVERYAGLDHTPAIEYKAISGINVTRRLDLRDGVSLIPFNDIPQSFVKDALDPALLKPENYLKLGLNPAAIRHQPPTSAVLKRVKIRPKYLIDDAQPPTFLLQSPALYEVCECLTLLTDSAPMPVASWVMPEEWVPCSGFTGGGLYSHFDSTVSNDVVLLTEQDLLELQDLYDKFNLLPDRLKERLRVPIHRLNQSRIRNNNADKAIDLGVAFEALYVNDRSHSDPIAFTLRLRAAWHLGRTLDEKNALMETFNKIYECRSIAVHRGRLEPEVKIKYRGKVSTKDFLAEADKLCAASIKKMVYEGGHPAWDDLILGANAGLQL